MPAHEHVFRKYLNKHFVETGTYKGEGIQCAVNSGFEFVRSVEIDETRYNDCFLKFRDNKNVSLYFGSTEDMLWNMIKDINEPITFWLDAHWSGDGEPMSNQKCPLETELKIISQHPIKTHTIMVDDMRCCNTDYFDFKSKELIEQAILKINPEYKLVYENSWEPSDILVATI
jgi:hypothetical protein